jgi:hypothetical protein
MSLVDAESPEPTVIGDFQFCDLCGVWRKTGGPGYQNGEKHFKQKHSKQVSSIETLPGSLPVNENSVIWEGLMTVIDKLRPISDIKDPAIKAISTSHRIWDILYSLKDTVDKRIARDLSRVTRLALVEDGWTDPNQRNYEGLWAHGMLDGRRVSFCIGQIPVERADSATLAPAIAARLLELGLTRENDHEISFIVGDSASVNPKIVATFNRETGNESSFLPCVAHALNNMMQAIWGVLRVHIQPLLLVIDTLRNNGAFNRYVKRKSLTCKLTNSDNTHGVTRIATACAVRWYSLTKMLSSAIALQPVICEYMRTELTQPKLQGFLTQGVIQQSVEILGVSQDHVFTDTEINEKFLIPDERASQPDQAERVIGIPNKQWDYATMANQLFGHFRDVVLSLEGEQFGTIADIWRGFLWIDLKRQALNHPDVNAGWTEAMNVWRRWEKRYPKLPTDEQRAAAIRVLKPDETPNAATIQELSAPLFQVAAFLRPSNIPQIFTRVGAGPEWKNAIACLKVVFDSVKYDIPEWRDEQALIARQQAPDSSPVPVRFGRFHAITEDDPLSAAHLTEWERYMKLQVSPKQDGVLDVWWRNHATEFPVFYYIAQMYLFVPGTSAGVERMFSIARRILTRLRMRMRANNAELLVFLHENIGIIKELQAAGEVFW